MTYTCKVCKETKTEAIDATGHTLTHHEKVDSTCTATGMEEYWKCSECNKFFADEACTKQVENLDDLVIPVKDHNWDEGKVSIAPTCEGVGEKTYTCTVCNTTKTEAIDPKGHTPVDVAAKDATCTEKGNTAGTKCSVCDTILS